MELLLGFLVAMSVTIALIPPLMQWAARNRFLDAPNERKVHSVPIPRVGGIAMAIGTLLALGLSGSFEQPAPAFVAAILVLLGFGVWDDRCTLDATTKFAGQIAAVLIVMLWGDVAVSSITLAERHSIPQWVSLPLTFFFLIGVTNAINLADGLDGLAGGTTLLSLAALALLALTSGVGFVGSVAIAIMGAILGFLRFNTHPARVFMGDGGSQILGFAAAVLAVVLTQDQSTPLSSALPLLLLGIPIIDTLMVMSQRMLEGRSPFSADRNHIHHRLLASGFDHHEAVVAIYLLQATLFVTAWFLRFESDLLIVAVFSAVATLAIALLQAAQRFGWRWRSVHAAADRLASPLSRALTWLRAPEHLPLWTLAALALLVAAFLVCSVTVAAHATPDIRIMAGVLATATLALMLSQWSRAEMGWLMRGFLYMAVVIAAYLHHEAGSAQIAPAMQRGLFALLIVCVILRFRFASDRRFKLTPLDVLVVLAVVIVPNLPGSFVTTPRLGESIARLIALMYAVETVLSAGARWWRLPSVAAALFLVICTAGGAI